MQDLEAQIAAWLEAGDHARVASEALRAYGGELYGFIVARVGREQHAEEVYALFSEDMWRGLPGYRGSASFRAWLYAIARNACHRYLDRDLRRQRRGTSLDDAHHPMAPHSSRTRTDVHLRTTGKRRGEVLRARLPEEEQVLLTLRIARGLDWREVAQALGAPPDELDRQAARYRKRFQLVREKLRRWARQEGWLSDAQPARPRHPEPAG